MIKLVEKTNHLAVHGHFYSLESANHHLTEVIPEYCKRGLFTDKTLTPDSFEIIDTEKEEFIIEGLDRNGITTEDGKHYKQWSSWKEEITTEGYERYRKVLSEAYDLGSRY